MKNERLYKIKDEIAIEKGWVNFIEILKTDTMCVRNALIAVNISDLATERFAKEVAKEALNNAKEKMEYEYADYEEMPDFGYIVDENNIPEL